MKFERFKFKNKDGKIVEFTCEESELANFFGANLNAPHFLTPIFFKKEVLDKYYSKPSKYSVRDGYFSYGNKWRINIDNNASSCVMVYLGDLGRLPCKEQQYWKVYNILKGDISSASFKRDFNAEFCLPNEPALFFKEKFKIFSEKWRKKFNWDLFKPLTKKEEHHYKTLRVPANEQKDFDELVLSLNKVLTDSLNVSEMKKNLSFNKEDKSIAILNNFLQQKYRLNSPQLIDFFRSLQKLRSTGSAHLKGEDYKKAYKKFDKKSLSKTFENILIHSIIMLNTLERGVLKDEK